MNVVDSSGWLEFFDLGPNGDYFSPPILDLENLLVPTIVLLEVHRRLLRESDEDRVLDAMIAMRQGTLVALDETLAVQAAELGVRHRLPLADSIVYAVARKFQGTVWTQDSDFEGLEGVEYLPKQRAAP
ncbi:MAG: type II toxin-antitoxin system VapC family toxin [Dehalococcoidia bacterium]